MSGSCRRHTPARRSGVFVQTPYEGGPVAEADTVQCVHCGYTSVWVAGSEKWWSYCARCAGPSCGQKACVKTGCVPQEQQLTNMETGRPLDFRPIIAPTRG